MQNLEEKEVAATSSPATSHYVQRNSCIAQTVPDSKKNTFAEIVATELSIYQQIEEAQGEISPALDLALQLVELEKAEKLDACKYVIDQFAIRADFLKQKEEEFRATRKTIENVIEKIKRRIKEGMTSLGIDEAVGNEYRFKLSVSKEPKIVIDEALLPETYQKVVQQYVPDREKIAEALSAGFQVPGATTEPVLTLRSYVVTKKRQVLT